MSTVNKLKNAWINTDTSLSGTYQTCSLLNNGASEFAGNVVIDNKLAINKAVDGANNYKLDVSGNACLSDLLIKNKNTLAKTKSITTTTTLQFGDPEYITIASNCAANSIITLPSVNNTNQLGTKYTFFYENGNSYVGITISTASGQTLTDNVDSDVKNTYIIGYFRSYVEMVCVSITAPNWAICNGNYDYDSLVFNNQDNVFSGDNTFPTQLTTDNSQKVATTQYVKSNLSSYQTTLGMSSYAPLSSPALTGNPTTTTQLTTDNSTRIASTAYVKSNLSNYQTTSGMSLYALLDSPTLTGTPHAPTTSSTANSTRIATTAFVKSLNYATTTYADGLITTLLNSVNEWTGTNTFDYSLPTSSQTPTLGSELVTKYFVEDNFQSITGMSSYQTITGMSLYVLQTYLDSNYSTTTYINNKFAPLANPTFTGNPITTTQLTTDNSTRIASTAYVKSNLSSYQTTASMSNYLTTASATSTYQPLSSMSNYLTITSATSTYQPLSSMSNYLTITNATSTYQPLNSMSNYALTSDLNTYYSTTAYIANNFLALTGGIITGSLTINGAVGLYNNTGIYNSKTFEISSGSTFNCSSGSTANFNGTTNINGNGYWNIPTNSSFLLQGNGVTFLELGPLALYSPISYSTNLNQTTFNGYIVFKTGFTMENNQTIEIGTSGYGNGYIQVAGNGSYINIQNSGGFFTNWIEPSGPNSSGSWYTTHASTLTFGNSNATLINNFASNTFVTLPSTTTAITSAENDNFITKRIANLLYCGVQSPTIFTPIFKITAPFIASGEIISTFSNDGGDTILIRNSGYGLTPNAMCIDTAQANGLSLNANTSTASINLHIAKTLIAKIVSSGLSISGNISFTGSLGSITQTIFGKIATAFGKQTFAEQSTVITTTSTISAPFSQIYGVNNGTTSPIVITLPQASSSNNGTTLLFRRLAGSTSTTIININTTGATQLIYTGNNGSSTLVSIMASGVFINRVTSLFNGTNYNWYFN